MSVRAVRVADVLAEEVGPVLWIRGVGVEVIPDAHGLVDVQVEHHPAQAVAAKPYPDAAVSEQTNGNIGVALLADHQVFRLGSGDAEGHRRLHVSPYPAKLGNQALDLGGAENTLYIEGCRFAVCRQRCGTRHGASLSADLVGGTSILPACEAPPVFSTENEMQEAA